MEEVVEVLATLFQRAGTSPLSGCLPMVVQFPVWIALYAMLGAVVDLYHEPFLWLPHLTQPDPYYILPISMGALMFVQTKMNPSAGDEAQMKMMQWVMPGVFVAMMLFLPSGLGVYIFANITLSLVQSVIQLRIPSGGGDKTAEVVNEHWPILSGVGSRPELEIYIKANPALRAALARLDLDRRELARVDDRLVDLSLRRERRARGCGRRRASCTCGKRVSPRGDPPVRVRSRRPRHR